MIRTPRRIAALICSVLLILNACAAQSGPSSSADNPPEEVQSSRESASGAPRSSPSSPENSRASSCASSSSGKASSSPGTRTDFDPPSGEDETEDRPGSGIPIAPFEWENIAARPIVCAAVGENFYFVPVHGTSDADPFAIEKYDANGRITRRAVLPNLGEVLRLKPSGGNLMVLSRAAILLIDAQSLEILENIPLPDAVRASLDAQNPDYDVSEDLSTILYVEKGENHFDHDLPAASPPAGSTLYDLKSGTTRFLHHGDSVRRIIGPDKKLLKQESSGSILLDFNGARPRPVGLTLDPQRIVDGFCLAQGAAVPGGDGIQNGLYDFAKEHFYAVPPEIWPDRSPDPLHAGIGGRLLYSIGEDGYVMRTDWTLETTDETGMRLGAGGQKSILAVSELGVLLYAAVNPQKEETALYLHALTSAEVKNAENVPEGAFVPPLPHCIARGESMLSDGTAVRLRLEMAEGYFWDQSAAGYVAGGGIYRTNYFGRYHIAVEDAQGRVLYNQPILDDPLNFSEEFSLLTDDYNGDGDPDFTLGQWESSDGNRYQMFTVRRSGRVEELDGAQFTMRSQDFSVAPRKISPVSFEVVSYDRERDQTVSYLYTWQDDSFFSALTPEEQADW